MLLNLSNHPKTKWDYAQLQAALDQFGSVEDVPFPPIDPKASQQEVTVIAQEYVDKCLDILAKAPNEASHAVHIMGEYTFTYQFLKEMEKRGILCVASTTERIVTEDPADPTKKITVFKFVQFRPYFDTQQWSRS